MFDEIPMAVCPHNSLYSSSKMFVPTAKNAYTWSGHPSPESMILFAAGMSRMISFSTGFFSCLAYWRYLRPIHPMYPATYLFPQSHDRYETTVCSVATYIQGMSLLRGKQRGNKTTPCHIYSQESNSRDGELSEVVQVSVDNQMR